MEQKDAIKSFSAEEIDAMLKKNQSLSDWQKIDAATQEEIDRAIEADPDSAPDPDPSDWDRITVEMTPPKTPFYMRLDADVLQWFRGQGKGYQGVINAVLRSYMHHKETSKH